MGARIGDGLAIGADVVAGAARAAADASLALGGLVADLAFVFVSGAEADDAARALAEASSRLGARTTIGCTAHGVMGSGRTVEGVASVSVWAACLPGVSLRGFHLEVIRTSDAIAVLGLPNRKDSDVVGVLLADPWSFPADGFVDNSINSLRGLPLVGGLASGAARAGQTRLLLDGKILDRGAVGVVVGGDVDVHTVVSQGCRPIGRALTVTAANGTAIETLGGQPAMARAQEAIASLDEDHRPLAIRGLYLGVAFDEYTDEHGSGDFLVRSLVGAESRTGALDVGESVPIGTTVQFLLRDADAAHDDLARVLDALKVRVGLTGIAGALVFSCNGRGRSMFASADHDAAAVRDTFGIEPVAGFFAAGEFGPVGGRNHLHGLTATVLAFGA